MAEPISVQEARERVLAAVAGPAPREPEEVPLEAARGRVLAEAATSSHAVPPFDASAMDGYAVVAGPAAELELAGEARAGHPFGGSVEPGLAVAISTGAPVPAGADAVVPLEQAEQAGAGRVAVPPTRPGAHIRRAGEDLPAGATVLEPGSELGAAELGVLASLGLAAVRCARRPRVAVIATGDELAVPGQPLAPGQIYGSNDHALTAQAEAAGGVVALRGRVADDAGATRRALEHAVGRFDVLVVSGGVSVGPHDHVKGALADLGAEEHFWGLRLKPGKPCWFGVHGRTLVFGLPGNPVSAMVTFQLLVLPALRALAGADPGATRATARLGSACPLNPSREQAVRCRLEAGETGWTAHPTGAQESHRLTSMLGADALALIPPGEGELPAGERVEIELLRR